MDPKDRAALEAAEKALEKAAKVLEYRGNSELGRNVVSLQCVCLTVAADIRAALALLRREGAEGSDA